jgi:hypothetical protein
MALLLVPLELERQAEEPPAMFAACIEPPLP